MDPRRKLISIVVPAYDEQDNVGPLYDGVLAALEPLADRYDVEFVFVDDASRDATFERLAELAERDPRVRVFRFSRNFGFQQAVATGFRKARGDAAVEIDCDLQDPPEVIRQFVAKWEAGWHVVYGVRTSREESVQMNLARRVAYRLIALLSEDDLPVDAGDFRLVDRRVLDELNAIDDVQPYLRGAIAALGFRQVGVEYSRHARARGTSKFPFRKLVQMGLDGILNHSVVPLRIATYMGLVTATITFLAIVGYVMAKWLQIGTWPAGFATTTTLLLFSISVNALFLGIIGEYLGRIYRQVKRRPTAIVERVIDHADASGAGSTRPPSEASASPPG